MKNILVPTDFSATATNATSAAMDLAVATGAHLHLHSRLDILFNWPNLSEKEKENYPENLQTIHNTNLLFKEWEEKAAARNVPLTTSWSAGKLIDNIKEYIEDKAIDFMVMGSHGASGKNEYFIGSNTQRVVRAVHCPVLIIKEDLSDYVIKKVVFASNFDAVEKRAFQYFLDFVQLFQPEIHLVEINTSSWFSQPRILVAEAMKDFIAMCGDLPCKTHFYRDWSVDAGIRNLSTSIGADLIGISNQQRHPLKRLTSGSNVEALVNHSKIPVLSIDFSKEEKE